MHRPEIPARPRILIVTPEITCLPAEMGAGAVGIRAKAGGLADDSFFRHQEQVYRDHRDDALYAELAFQREVIHRILPRVRPDLVHCNDWISLPRNPLPAW
jgi:hypothetical protein